jgi:hypothetical protein
MRRWVPLAIVSGLALVAVLGTLLTVSIQSSNRADRAAAVAAEVKRDADRAEAARVEADRVAAAKAAEQKRTAAAVKKALADKKAADQKAADKAGNDRVYAAPRSSVVTLSSLGSKPCTELANRGVGWTQMNNYFLEFGRPASMDIDYDWHPCETVYGDVN